MVSFWMYSGGLSWGPYKYNKVKTVYFELLYDECERSLFSCKSIYWKHYTLQFYLVKVHVDITLFLDKNKSNGLFIA